MDVPLPKPTLPPEAPNSPIAPGPVPEAATIASLQTKLEDARREYLLRHYDEVERILGELESNSQPATQGSSTGEQFAERSFLRASVFCLKGRLVSAKGTEVDAREAFMESVRLFESQKSEMEQHKFATRMRTDYGMALSHIGRTQEAMHLLKQVCESGAAPPEAFGYLGVAYRQSGHLAEAVNAFSQGLQLVPGEPRLLRYLAEALDAVGKQSEAVSAYCDAALAATDLQIRAHLAHRALEIAPTDVRALNIAVNMQFAGQQPERSLAIVNAALQLDPNHAWALGLKGSLLRISGDLDEALKTLRAIDVQTPELSWVLGELAETLHQLDSGHDTEALELLDRASMLNPQDAGALYSQARIRLARGETFEAIVALDQAVTINPQSAVYQGELGRSLFLSDDFERAEQAFDRALVLDPKSTLALTGKGAILRHREALDEALDLYRRALRADPDNEFTFQAVVDVLLDQGRIDEALEEVNGEIQRSPYRALAQWRKGRILLDQNDLNGAARAFETAVSLDPNNPDVIGDRAETLLRLEEYGEAGKAYDRLLQLQPESPYAIGVKAIYLSEIASFHEASQLLDHAIEKAPDEAWLWGRQGWCLENLGPPSMERARDAYEKALSIKEEKEDEDDLWERKGLANTLCQLGRKDEAKTHFEKIIEKQKYREGNDAQILAALGWCHYRLSRYDEAVRLIHASLSVDEDPSAQFDLGLVLLASSRLSLASAEYQRAIDLSAKKHVLRQRGLYYIALFDLVEAARDTSFGQEGEAIFALLRDRLRDSGVELAPLSWLGQGVLASNAN